MTLDAGLTARAHRLLDPPASRSAVGGQMAEEVRAVVRVDELRECPVKADRLLRVVLDCRLRDEQADQPEHDGTCEMAGEADAPTPSPLGLAHLA